MELWYACMWMRMYVAYILYSSTVKSKSVTGTYVGVAAKTIDWPPTVQEKKIFKKEHKKAELAVGEENECPGVVWWWSVCVI